MRLNLLIRGICGGTVLFILIFSLKSWLGFLISDEYGGDRKFSPIGRMEFEQSIGRGDRLMDMAQQDVMDVMVASDDPRSRLKRKIVHLDLKGMPPRISYFAKLFPLFKEMGVTGLLVEYEDMFPYFGPLAGIANRKSYTRLEIAQLNLLASESNLQVIPLIQTFGHLEFVLKLEDYLDLREVPRYPQVLCPSNNRSLELVEMMIDQVMSLHPDVTQVHIGSDEVYHIGLCSRCVTRMSHLPARSSDNPKVELFLSHVKRVAKHLIKKHNKRPMMWDDEFRQLDEYVIQNSGLGQQVDIVVWHYRTDVDVALDSSLWAKYKRLFPSIWIGSAFKGADNPNSMVVNEGHYLANHYSWIQTLRSVASDVKMEGIVITGWQRYDHFAVLCEILGVAIPSLVSCLTYLNYPGELSMERVMEVASGRLHCQSPLSQCSYPGAMLYEEVQRLQRHKMELEHVKNQSIFRGWAHPNMNLRTGFSNPAHIDNIIADMGRLKIEFDSLRSALDSSLKLIYPDWSVREWLLTHFEPTAAEIECLYNSLSKILDKTTFPVRPFEFNATMEEL